MIVACPHCGKAWQPQSREVRRYIETQEAIQMLFDKASELFDTDMVMIKGTSKIKRHVHGRQWCALRMREMGMTLKEIGYHLGGREHTTIMHHIKVQTNRELAVINNGVPSVSARSTV